VVFTGKERRVEITGEAYFEVKKSLTGSGENQSFIVSDGKMEITVLGTHFNVNSYGDDGRIRVTLLEGSVSVQSGVRDQQSEVVIKPGQQAVLTAQDLKLTTNNSPNLEAVMAWKDGRFYFEGADINEVLQQIGRWYDLDVKNATKVSGIRIGGIMSRNKNLSEVLKALELSDVHFRLEGKKLIVVP
jgi:ferric-dicitrate binding protein FerR (iron transport regulator)